MENEIIDKFAELIVAIDKADTEKICIFKTTPRDMEAIQIAIPENLINNERFNRKILELGMIPSRLTSRKKDTYKNQKSSKTIYTYLVEIVELDIVTLDEQCKSLNEQELKKLSAKQIAFLILQVYRLWNTLPGGLKTHRRPSQGMVKGYLKQRETYTHIEILKALKVYGKWAEARRLAIKDGEIDSFWFHRWDLDSLLISNKAMNHIGDGWKELTKSKGIPEEYAGIEPDRPKYQGMHGAPPPVVYDEPEPTNAS